MKIIRFFVSFSCFPALRPRRFGEPTAASRKRKKVIADLEKRIANESGRFQKLQKGRAATEERVRRLARQIDSRNQLLDETEKQASLLREGIARKDSVAGDLASTLERNRAQYAEMVGLPQLPSQQLPDIPLFVGFRRRGPENHRFARGRRDARTQDARHRAGSPSRSARRRRSSTAATVRSTR